MIPFKKIKPFVFELLVFLFIVFFISFTILAEGFVTIIFSPNLITVSLSIILLICFIYLFSRVVNIGFRVLIDYLFQKADKDKYTFIKQLPYSASVFSEKWDKNHRRSIGMYYLVQVKKEDKIYTFLSPCYLE